jgi:phage tail protein X
MGSCRFYESVHVCRFCIFNNLERHALWPSSCKARRGSPWSGISPVPLLSLTRLIRSCLLASFVVGCASSALAQPVVDPRIAEFNPSPDHSEVVDGVAVVTRYELEISVVGSSTPVRVLSLGKPNPETDGIIRVVIETLLTPPLNVGVTYEARVAAVGPGGRGRSAPSNQFVFESGTCGYTVTPTSRSIPAGGGSSTFSVTTNATCEWTAVSQSSWITVTSGSSDTGNGTVGFTVAANSGPARSGTILIAGENVTVTQPAVPTCSYDVTPNSRSMPVGGGNSTFSVATTSGCTWTADSQTSWITVTGGSNVTGNGTVSFTAAANTGAARSGSILIAGENVTVSQPAVVTCSYDVTPNSRSMPVGGGNSTFSVATTSGCTWTAVSQTGWITVTSGSSGSGNGTVNFSAAANTGPARSGSFLIAGETVTVSQPSGTTCSYNVTPTSRSMPVGGGSSTFSVATTSGCVWTADSEVGWITVTSGGSGSGNGTVGFTAAANTGPSRTGTINIAGRDVSVTQPSGGTCTYTISPLTPAVGASGGAVTISVSSQSGCSWTSAESPNVSWVSITSGASGSGNGTVRLSVTANGQATARTMRLTVGGRTVTLTQNGTAQTLTSPKGLRVIR